ncbi:MAG: Xaa-Pro peptidase family protein [Proteobacteria bacterium]|nr:Xaa-Pro peptidase family protein [Pseudomonadota bacterium]
MDRQNRILQLQRRIKDEGLGCALLFYSRDIFYYTGTAQPSYLLVLPDEYFLFVRSGYDFAVKDVFISTEQIQEERNIETIYAKICSGMKNRKIATELDILPTKQYFGYTKIFDGWEFLDVSPMVLEQRMTKDPYEIEQIKKACTVIHAGHMAALSTLREGVTELELAAAVENAHRLAGHEGEFFTRLPDFFMSRGPIGSGPNLKKFSGVVYSVTGVGLSPSVPAGPSMRRIRTGDIVVVDIPTLVYGYHADQTRTYFLGRCGAKLRDRYDRLKEIHESVIESIRPGMSGDDIYRIAAEKAEKLKVAEEFLSFGNGKRSHMIGHGLGLEISEPPILSAGSSATISENYVLGIEMHLLDDDAGAMKLEDTVLVQRHGNEILTESSRELGEVY